MCFLLVLFLRDFPKGNGKEEGCDLACWCRVAGKDAEEVDRAAVKIIPILSRQAAQPKHGSLYHLLIYTCICVWTSWPTYYVPDSVFSHVNTKKRKIQCCPQGTYNSFCSHTALKLQTQIDITKRISQRTNCFRNSQSFH